MNKLKIYTDGGSRGNPGPSAIGVIVGNRKYSEFIGVATNNQAEYQAVIFALQKAKQLKAREIEIFLDSDLVCKQLNKEFKIKDKKIQPLFIKVWNLSLDFDSVSFNCIPREENKEADKLVNQELDRRLRL